MRRRAAAVVIAWCLAFSDTPVFSQSGPEADLAAGVQQVEEGSFDQAVVTLDRALRAFEGKPAAGASRQRATLYLGIAYLGLGQEGRARGYFRDVLRQDPNLVLTTDEYPPGVVQVFDDVRRGRRDEVAATDGGAPKAPAAAAKKGGGGKALWIVLGGGAAAAGIAAAAGGGGSKGGTQPTTTAGGGATTTTVTPGTTTPGTTTPGTTTPGTTTPGTTTPGTTTPATTTTTTSTTTTTTTMPPACTYALSPDRTFSSLGGNGTCNVTVNPQSCNWTVTVVPSSATWLTLNGSTSGTGSGSVSYSVAALSVGTRSARIQAQQDPNAACTITQNLLGPQSTASAVLHSRLDLPGGRSQIVVNGAAVTFQREAETAPVGAVREGQNRVEAIVVAADGGPGTWRFDVPSGRGLVVIAGQARLVSPTTVVFQLSGKQGERVVFGFSVTGAPAP